MLTRATLTIRLHPDDDVVIARQQLVGGTQLIDENVTVRRLVPPGAQGRDARDRQGRAGQALQPDHRLRRRATSPRASTCTCTTSRWASFDRDYAFGADAKPTQYVDARRDVPGHRARADGRVATRNYIGILSTVNCSATVARGIADQFTRGALTRVPERRRRRRADARLRLRHGHAGRRHAAPAPHARRLRASTPNFAGVLIIGLGCEANQISALLGAAGAQGRPAAAHVQHPGHRRHGEDDRARHRR